MSQGRTMLYACLACLALFGLLAASSGASGATAANPVVVLQTNKGPISVELFADKAPATVKNFLSYVDKGFYDNTIFHRVIPNFMIQGGGFPVGAKSQADQKKTDAPVKNEAGNGLKNQRGTLAMARTGDPDSATAQFFINLADNAFLDRDQAQDGFGYTVFGKVIDGMDAVDKIAQVKTARDRLSEGTPTEPVIIQGVKRQTP